MTIFRGKVRGRRWVALLAAYAVFFHGFFGGIVLSKHVGTDPFVICYGLGDDGGNGQSNKVPVKHLPCSLCNATQASGTAPQSVISIDIAFVGGERLELQSIARPVHLSEFSPRLSQGPPFNV